LDLSSNQFGLFEQQAQTHPDPPAVNVAMDATTEKLTEPFIASGGAPPVAAAAMNYGAVRSVDTQEVVVLPGGYGAKRGHKCCGGCCDVRRAVIVVNCVVGGLVLWGVLAVLALKTGAEHIAMKMDDDEAIAAMNKLQDAPIVPLLIRFSIALICCVFGVLGAIQYNVWMVYVAALKLCVDIVVGLCTFNVAVVIAFSLFLYPHVFFIKEVREGIMSKDNYENERQSCCCA
jgi:hypothetical protein